jgi:hypothetical protein
MNQTSRRSHGKRALDYVVICISPSLRPLEG